jgi:hypothetical protein
MSCGTDTCPMIQSGGGSTKSTTKSTTKRSTKSTKKKSTKKNLIRYKRMTVKSIDKIYKENKGKPIYYFYDDGEYSDKKIIRTDRKPDSSFIPNGNMEIYRETIVHTGNNNKPKKITKSKIIKKYLGNDKYSKQPYKKGIKSNKKYYLNGLISYGIGENEDYENSGLVVCSDPLNIVSENCVGGVNWIVDDKGSI